MVIIKNDAGNYVQTFVYGATNARLMTNDIATNQFTYYVWSGSQVIAEYTEVASSGNPQWTKSYVYAEGRLLSTATSNGAGGEITEYQHSDQLGTRLVTNQQTGAVYEQAVLPFGTSLGAETSGTTNRRFTSYDRAAATGLDYAVNRTFDSGQGRFTTVDPLGMAATSLSSPQSLNMYAYVENDPVNFVDPSGLNASAVIVCRTEPDRGYVDSSGVVHIIQGRTTCQMIGGGGSSGISTTFTPREPSGIGGGGAVAQDQPSDKGFPCPPDWQEIIKRGGITLFDALSKTWEDARKNNREEGGWILMNKKGEVFAFRKERDSRDRQTSIGLIPPKLGEGLIVVANFHTHDTGAQPSETVPGFLTGDVDLNNRRDKIPGLILGNTLGNNVHGVLGGGLTIYGPQSGFYGIGLPERCKKSGKKG